MARLLLMHDDVVISDFELRGPVFTIGRALHCNLTIDDPLVSQHHAQIERHEAPDGTPRYILKDLNSTNGSFINGKQIQEQELKDRDLLRFGTKHFVFRDEAAQEQQKTKKLRKSWIPGVFYTKD